MQNQIQELFKEIQSCKRCELSKNTKPIYYRGNLNSKYMIIGEGPGLIEERQQQPLVGPAGQLLDKIFSSVNLNTNDFYVTNILKCRYIAPKNSNKQNLTPTSLHCNACKIYLAREIKIINPKLVVLIGRIAINTVLPQNKTRQMNEIVGTINYNTKLPNIKMFLMYHPAAILHNSDTEKYFKLKKEMFKHIKLLREIINE